MTCLLTYTTACESQPLRCRTDRPGQACPRLCLNGTDAIGNRVLHYIAGAHTTYALGASMGLNVPVAQWAKSKVGLADCPEPLVE